MGPGAGTPWLPFTHCSSFSLFGSPRPHPGSVSKSRRPRLLLGSLPTPKHFASTAEELLSLWQALPTKKPQPAEGRGRRVFDVQSGNSKSLFVQEAPPRALSARSAPASLTLCLSALPLPAVSSSFPLSSLPSICRLVTAVPSRSSFLRAAFYPVVTFAFFTALFTVRRNVTQLSVYFCAPCPSLVSTPART